MSSFDCPKCSQETRVINSRAATSGVRRRRRCMGCDFRFSTIENAYFTSRAPSLKAESRAAKQGTAP